MGTVMQDDSCSVAKALGRLYYGFQARQTPGGEMIIEERRE